MGRRVGDWHNARLAEFPLAPPRCKHLHPCIKGPSWIGKTSSSYRNLLLDALPLRLDSRRRVCYFWISEGSPFEHGCGFVCSGSCSDCGKGVRNLASCGLMNEKPRQLACAACEPRFRSFPPCGPFVVAPQAKHSLSACY